MFADIAPDYDRANTILSFGIHGRWRKRAVEMAKASPGFDVLDCATGTGDLARAFADQVQPGGRVVGIDFVSRMVRLAREKLDEEDVEVELGVADALRLPFADDRFDMASIGFGIRNVDDPERCLVEMARVVKQGGRVVVLEFGQPEGLVGVPYRFYGRHVIPRVGELLTGNREAYEYLPSSQAEFPAGDAFLEMAQEAGVFHSVEAEALMGGLAWVYVGEVA